MSFTDIKIDDTCQIIGLAEIYKEHFGNQNGGYFVEVGAYDGNSWSNTSGLADIGWRGLYIEPIKQHMDLCRQRHANNNVAFEQYAIGTIETDVEIIVAGGLSTTSEQCHNAHKSFFDPNIFRNESRTTVKQQRLDTILARNNVQPHFDLLIVDVEGQERDVFDSFSVNQYRPKMIIAELCDHHSGFVGSPDLQNDARLVRQLLLGINYKQIYCDAINTIFVDTLA